MTSCARGPGGWTNILGPFLNPNAMFFAIMYSFEYQHLVTLIKDWVISAALPLSEPVYTVSAMPYNKGDLTLTATMP
jgi:hypothetical protein